MKNNEMVWRTDAAGHLAAEDQEYLVTVERLLPAADAQFKVWTRRNDPEHLVASGFRPSAQAAMRAAEETAAAMRRHSRIAD